jgi:hypothetical protein
MCYKFFKIIILLFFCQATFSFGIDTTKEELVCTEIGFTNKTESFANCVVELYKKRTTQNSDRLVNNKINTQNPHEKMCIDYGFQFDTVDFSRCKMQLDHAKRDIATRQAQQSQEQRRHEEQLSNAKRQRDIAANLALVQCGLNMMSGGSCLTGQRSPAAPTGPIPSLPLYQNITLPSGRIIQCTNIGTNTVCH